MTRSSRTTRSIFRRDSSSPPSRTFGRHDGVVRIPRRYTCMRAIETQSLPPRVIEPSIGWRPIDWRELWAYRELLGFLIWRDAKVRYKQTVLGVAWAVLQPLMTMVLFTLLFGRWAKMPSDGVPYSLFAFAALIPWTFFSNSLAAA